MRSSDLLLRDLRAIVVHTLVPVTIAFLPCTALAQQLDVAAWGADHVGKPLPAFASGDECLFCHRDVGPLWPSNRHGQTIRAADPQAPPLAALAEEPLLKGLAAEVDFLMGTRSRHRFLKRSAEHGRLELLTVEWVPSKSGRDGRLTQLEQPHWDRQAFGQNCAGCHATGADSIKQTFTAASLDCFVCHGEVPEQHTTSGKLVYLSPQRPDSARVIASICGQCHLRGGVAQSSGRPYPNNFVAGDNLFRDFKVDFSASALESLNPGDRHVFENIRDIVQQDRQDVTCLSCHEIHKQSTQRHRGLADSRSCLTCHQLDSKKTPLPYQRHSKTCGY